MADLLRPNDTVRLGDESLIERRFSGETLLAAERGGDAVRRLEVDVNRNLYVAVANQAAGASAYGAVSAVPAGVLTTVMTYNATGVKTVVGGTAGGSNWGAYTVFLNGNEIESQWTGPGGPFSIAILGGGILLDDGDTLEVKVIHNRPWVGAFSARLAIGG